MILENKQEHYISPKAKVVEITTDNQFQKYNVMNSEKVMTQIVNSTGEYTAPKVKVVEIKARRVICASPSGTPEQYNNGTWNW